MTCKNKVPTLSIVIATFNSAITIKRALDSVINQKYKDWECIIVDGFSQDDTIKIVKEYAEKEHRITYISEPDNGIYDAFNKGWKLSSGKWIYYLGSDDYLTNDGLYNLLKDSSDVDCLYGGVYRIAYNNLYVKKEPFKNSIALGTMISHQAMLMQKKHIERMNGFDLQYKVSADFDLVTRSIISGARFEMRPYYIAYFSSGGACSSMLPIKEASKILYMNRVLTKKQAKVRYCKRYVRNLYWIYVKWPIGKIYLEIKKMIK